MKKVDKTSWGQDILECPVCKTHCIEQGMRNHILNKAKGELFDFYLERKRRDLRHLKYVSGHTEKQIKEVLKLKIK